jgi:ketosteroid isomerase-like protein
MSEENVEVVRRAMAAWNSGRFDDLIEELFDPNVEWVPAAESLLAAAYHGYEGVRRFRADLFSAWDEYALDTPELVDAGDQVVLVTQVQARTREIRIDQVWSALVTVRDGKIAHFQGFTTRKGALEAAGMPE